MKPVVFNSLYWGTMPILLWACFVNAAWLKELSMVLLIVYAAVFYISGTRYTPTLLRVLLIIGLAITSPPLVHLLAGASIPLVHIVYIAYFLKIRYTNYPLPTCKWAFIFLTEALGLAIFFYYLPTLENVWPVVFCLFTASIALQSVMHAFRLSDQPAGWYCLAGITFLIAGGAFSPTISLICYALANYGLVYGATRYIWQKQGIPYAIR
ncbi:hypothetical protein SIO70_06010 [Chitinophaga sancti]|uniref:hypothetical protein n=1 Tax=Chitinophaga sancti TaxID=1004 RepID=UPI002A7580FE|nr:hypothetical protein [Chitinophaga sancti]WPQ64421.1 hypothetical protein SIO70_06010 [Chitinophaga sancti]